MPPTLVVDLPPLAWGLVSRPGEVAPRIVHGSSVVVGDGFLCDGTWDGPCDRTGYREAVSLFGSGVDWDGRGAVRVRTALWPMERVWSLEASGAVAVSNSLPLVLALGGSRLDPSYLHYEADLLWFVERRARLSRRVRTADGAVLRQYGGAILRVGQGRITEPEFDRSFERRAPVSSFAGYRADLSRTLAALFENLADSRRPRTYSPLATLSSGYDSTACAVLAREQGAAEAITFRRARDVFEDSDDDGTRIGEVLGLSVIGLDRYGYQSGDGTAERWSLAYGAGGEDVIFDSYEELPGRGLVTGYLGDTVWQRSVDHHLLRGRFPGADGCLGIGEHRIQRDFVHLPLPVVDVFRQTDIVRISNGGEMRPWMVGGSYDRPIPRRIGEEAGVPREWFGGLKKAASAPFYHPDALDSFGPAALEQLREWVAHLDPAPDFASYQRQHDLVRRWRELTERVHDISTRHPIPGWLGDLCRPRHHQRWRRPAHESLLAVTWAVETTREHYLAQLGGEVSVCQSSGLR